MHEDRGDLPRLVADLSAGRLTAGPPRDFVLLLQEAAPPGTPRGVPGLSRFDAPVDAEGGRLGVAILSTQPLEDTRIILLPEERQRRAAAAASITVAGQRLFVVSAHLENRLGLLRGGPFGDRARERQARALVGTLPPDAPGIAGGDMNTMLGPREPALRVFLDRFGDTPPPTAKPTFRERLVLDHLFFDLPDGWHAARRVLPEHYGSDHHPVLGLVFGSS